MSIEINPANVQIQKIEVDVNGPDDINKMFIINGQARISLQAATSETNQNVTRDETFKIKLTPKISNTEFRRSIANAHFSNIQLFDLENTPTNRFENVSWSITDVDADYDDESEQEELRIAIKLSARGERNSVSAGNIGFNVTTLASMHEH